jgi:hypothetical protein
MPVKEREKAISEAVGKVAELDAAGAALERGDTEDAARHVERAKDATLQHAPPVPVGYASYLLEVSQPTVRDWLKAGILKSVPSAKTLSVTLASVLDARQAVTELRKLGRDKNLRAALLARIEDQQTLADESLQRALEQMRSGRKHYVRDEPEVRGVAGGRRGGDVS